MTTTSVSPNQVHWLKQYYFVRTGVSFLWIAAAFAVGQHSEPAATILLISYPAWDALANYLDASRSGGLAQNRTQLINVIVSVLATLAVAFTIQISMNWVIGVFGAWAILAGLLQLATAARRWKTYGAQWAMILSGGQSALVGGILIFQARMPVPPSILNIAGYASGGAFYFLVSAVWLVVSELRQRASTAS
ncbi:DUF308 domain-containing protein [Bradyrhizobium sp. HKCCYLS20291]|uniref:DUF308 domain-containing protein n=1 Tax=Bradyrhizobium sp. HKCCYLS20291 TaxID=3420766 RepID=UPI003EB979E1